VGDRCPDPSCGGRLYDLNEPKVLLQFTGRPWIEATNYEREVLRCARCQERYEAPLPEGVADERYDASCDATIALRNMDVPVEVELLQSTPSESFGASDQVNECDIEIRSGTLVIAGCTDYFPDAARIKVEPGSYRARVYYGKLDSLSEDGLDGNDHYKVSLWMSEPSGLHILKRRSRP
jgi:hypothetical protein